MNNIECEEYIKNCCAAWESNPPQNNPSWESIHDYMDGVRYYAHIDGVGLAAWPEEECKKHLSLFWNSYIKTTFGTRYMTAFPKFNNKKLYKWIMEAREAAL